MTLEDVPSRLGPWKVGKKLGTGAFGSVFACDFSDSVSGSERDLAEIRKRQWVLKVAQVPEPGKKRKKNAQANGASLLFQEYNVYRTMFEKARKQEIPVPAGPLPVSWRYQSANGFCFLAMERLGTTLSEKMKDAHSMTPAATVFNIAAQIILGLEFLHSLGYVFRDVKPDNFMLGLNENKDKVYIVDFGAAFKNILHTGKQSDATTAPAGTPLYMSRDVHHSKAPGPCDDLESLGYMMIWMLTGTLPWAQAKSENEILQAKEGSSPDSLVKNVQDSEAKRLLKLYFNTLFGFDEVDYTVLVKQLTTFVGCGSNVDALVAKGLSWKGAASARCIKEKKSSVAKKPATAAPNGKRKQPETNEKTLPVVKKKSTIAPKGKPKQPETNEKTLPAAKKEPVAVVAMARARARARARVAPSSSAKSDEETEETEETEEADEPPSKRAKTIVIEDGEGGDAEEDTSPVRRRSSRIAQLNKAKPVR